MTRFGLLALASVLICACTSTGPVATAPRVDPAIAQQVNSARAAYEAGAYGRAAKFYRQALSRARALDDSAEIGRNAYNAAACLLRDGKPGEALPLLVEAERELRASGQSVQPVLVLRGRAEAAVGEAAAAMVTTSNAIASAANDSEQFAAIADRFEAAIKSGDLAAAERELKRLERRREHVAQGPATAIIEDARGQFMERQGRPAEASTAYAGAAVARRGLGDLRQMSDAWSAAGRTAMAAGDAASAADFHYRAARSRFGRNDLLAALGSVREALKAADAAKDERLHDQVSALLGEIKKAVDGGLE